MQTHLSCRKHRERVGRTFNTNYLVTYCSVLALYLFIMPLVPHVYFFSLTHSLHLHLEVSESLSSPLNPFATLRNGFCQHLCLINQSKGHGYDCAGVASFKSNLIQKSILLNMPCRLLYLNRMQYLRSNYR